MSWMYSFSWMEMASDSSSWYILKSLSNKSLMSLTSHDEALWTCDETLPIGDEALSSTGVKMLLMHDEALSVHDEDIVGRQDPLEMLAFWSHNFGVLPMARATFWSNFLGSCLGNYYKYYTLLWSYILIVFNQALGSTKLQSHEELLPLVLEISLNL